MQKQGVASTREAVKKIHPDWDDERIDEVNNEKSLDTMQFSEEDKNY